MLARAGNGVLWRRDLQLFYAVAHRRCLHNDGRNRLSTFWAPTVAKKPDAGHEDGADLLVRAGFLRQAYSGVFHLLPLGLRVQDKIERLIDKHMQRIGASKVSLSSFSSQDLWAKSGRLVRNSELFHLKDRRDTKYLLSPTHEEEITNVVKNSIHSYRDLPLRLYQVSRKYRDELRPRQGLLRGREFIMKDLYTFDETEEHAMETYEAVQLAYRAFLDEINLPYVVATADSGNMGGNHSHEYHFTSSNGEDTIINCGKCGLCINEELYLGRHVPNSDKDTKLSGTPSNVALYRVLKPTSSIEKPGEATSTEQDLTNVAQEIIAFVVPSDQDVNVHALKKLLPDQEIREISTSELDDLKKSEFQHALRIIRDPRVSSDLDRDMLVSSFDSRIKLHEDDIATAPYLLTKAHESDPCPSCATQGTLTFQKAVEIGHTFHLGKRYSHPLEAMVKTDSNQMIEVEMGCHGIGVSRMIGAAASLLLDEKGLNWPVSIAPFGVVLLGAGATAAADVDRIYDTLSLGLYASPLDAIIDDRDRPVGWKLNDADLIGYPFIVVLGKAWKKNKTAELQCRRLGVKEEIGIEELVPRIIQYSAKL